MVIQVLTRKSEGQGTLLKYLDKNLITFLEDDTQAEAISSLVDLLDLQGKLLDKKAFHAAILEREKIVSTGIGAGVAIPHAKLPITSLGANFFVAIGVQRKKGIGWNALDGSLVRLIFMVGGPDNRQTEYLKILSSLTQAVKDDFRRQRLFKASSSEEIMSLFLDC